jgi:membrane peptidoglycan carboxypeptidase
MADAYATLASGGIYHRPQAILKVVFPSGRVDTFKPQGRRVLSPGVAYVVNTILRDNARYGTAAAIPGYYSGVAAGKTGTTDDSADAWFCGYNPALATAVWMGYPRTEIPMPGVQGATYCVPIWASFYRSVFGSREVAGFSAPAALPVWRPWERTYASRALSAASAPSETASASPAPAITRTMRPTGSPAPSHRASSTPSPSPTSRPPTPTPTP